mmetsp:Transcript_7766/g.17529  ORF Transcript_7766/g.17529 Transcript_7766/m.17529 type:complete len:450 (+) Transcript_7766:142-1491(+)|eukprot:CAMPEP_0172300892 /NCGR_PEP_ID=MMETSP1058-20130122/2890_1 /TAXON_ID=83371 /ORGANISM="Detonula confervacea, Strain CCMP 353" /LENGTH=449 /DNA_ID=CAMNT_0013010835 /DNA_START=83 /DNA_END=1432 /DNA_ORIENTATION=+
MTDFASHLAAIGVGVAIALFFVGRSKNNSAETTAKTAIATTASSKKKSKKKAAAPKPAPAPEPVKAAPKEAAPAPAPATQPNGGKKKKTKKNKKNGTAVTANGNSNNNANSTPAAAPAPTPTPPVPAPAATPFQSRIVEEDGWETIPKKSKKKKIKKPVAAPAGGAANNASLSVTIDASRIGIIIGPKGATMNAIQEKTGTKLEVNAPKLDDTKTGQFRPVVGGGGRSGKKQTATVVITEGSSETRQLAKTTVLELADRGYAALLQADGFGESSVSVHPRFLSEIVGPGGKIIKAIQTNLDVKLTIPKTDWTPKTMQIGNIAPSVRVGIAGDSQQNVKTAKQVIRDLCDYHHHEVTHPGFCHKEIYVPHEYFHCVIGTRGSEIKHIRGNYKVDVYMPSDESWCTTENVVCVGKSKDVEKAISYIKLLMDRDSEVREQKYSDEPFGDDGW